MRCKADNVTKTGAGTILHVSMRHDKMCYHYSNIR